MVVPQANLGIFSSWQWTRRENPAFICRVLLIFVSAKDSYFSHVEKCFPPWNLNRDSQRKSVLEDKGSILLALAHFCKLSLTPVISSICWWKRRKGEENRLGNRVGEEGGKSQDKSLWRKLAIMYQEIQWNYHAANVSAVVPACNSHVHKSCIYMCKWLLCAQMGTSMWKSSIYPCTNEFFRYVFFSWAKLWLQCWKCSWLLMFSKGPILHSAMHFEQVLSPLNSHWC